MAKTNGADLTLEGWALTFGVLMDGTKHPNAVTATKHGYKTHTYGDGTVGEVELVTTVMASARAIDARIAAGELPPGKGR